MLDITDKSVVQRIITEMNKTEDRDRRTYAFDSWRAYSGEIEDYVLEKIKTTRPKSYEGYTIANIALSKMIVDKLAKAYKEQPIRKIEDDSSQVKTDAYTDILKEAGARDQLPFFDQTTFLHKYGLLWVNWLKKEERYQMLALQPYEFAVIRDKNTGELECVILNYGNTVITSGGAGTQLGDGMSDLIAESQIDSAAQSDVYALWTKDNHVVAEFQRKEMQTAKGTEIQLDVTFVEDPENKEMVNPLGVLPFVFYSQELAVDYPTKSPLYDQAITYNALMSEYLTASNIQGTGQMIIKYPEKFEGMFKRMTRGLLSAIKLPQSDNPDDAATEVDYINPSPDLAGQKEAVMTYMQSVMKEHGISAGSSIDMESFSSGLERAIANANVDDIVMKKQEQLTEIEKKVFEIVKTYERVVFNSSTFSEEDQLNVTFKKPKVMMSDSETLDNLRKKVDLGIMSRADLIMALDPNKKREEAEAEVARIDQENMGFLRGSNGSAGQSNEEA